MDDWDLWEQWVVVGMDPKVWERKVSMKLGPSPNLHSPSRKTIASLVGEARNVRVWGDLPLCGNSQRVPSAELKIWFCIDVPKGTQQPPLFFDRRVVQHLSLTLYDEFPSLLSQGLKKGALLYFRFKNCILVGKKERVFFFF